VNHQFPPKNKAFKFIVAKRKIGWRRVSHISQNAKIRKGLIQSISVYHFRSE
jgi:hypothetical protein